jgi:hypothetical protein
MKVTVADSIFLEYGKNIKANGANAGVSPTYFEWERADPDTARFVTDSDIKHAKGPGQVALLLETFFLHPENYLAAMEKPFDAVFTHNKYFVDHKDNWLWYPHGGSFVAFNNWKIHKKTKNVSILLSPKNTLWGHKRFYEAAERFGDRLDVYGLDSYADKMQAIAPYHFSVAIEAERSDSFFSEKLVDCLALGTIPIYLGCPNIGDFFDPFGLIQVQNVDQIGDWLDALTPNYYHLRRHRVAVNLEAARQYAIPEDWIFKHYPFLFGE